MPKFPATPAAGDRRVEQFPLHAAQTFKLGAAVYLDATPDVNECGDDPATILGFATEPATKDPESSAVVLVAKCEEGRRFWMSGSSNPAATDVNLTYGIDSDADGIWVVDKTETTNTRVYVHQVDLTRNLFLVSVLEAYRQTAP